MKLVVIESPYAGEVEKNVEYAKRCIRDCLMRDEAPIASHLLFTQPGILNDKVQEERKLGIRAGLGWHKVADLVVVYTDLGISSGMEGAIEYAKSLKKPIEFRSLT